MTLMTGKKRNYEEKWDWFILNKSRNRRNNKRKKTFKIHMKEVGLVNPQNIEKNNFTKQKRKEKKKNKKIEIDKKCIEIKYHIKYI